MKLYLAFFVILCHFSLTLIKKRTIPKEAKTNILITGNNKYYRNNSAVIINAIEVEKPPSKKYENKIVFKKVSTVKDLQ